VVQPEVTAGKLCTTDLPDTFLSFALLHATHTIQPSLLTLYPPYNFRDRSGARGQARTMAEEERQASASRFPTDPADFDSDPRISFSKLDGKFILETDDGQEFAYDDALKRWVQDVCVSGRKAMHICCTNGNDVNLLTIYWSRLMMLY
jgi:hypothetical protein